MPQKCPIFWWRVTKLQLKSIGWLLISTDVSLSITKMPKKCPKWDYPNLRYYGRFCTSRPNELTIGHQFQTIELTLGQAQDASPEQFGVWDFILAGNTRKHITQRAEKKTDNFSGQAQIFYLHKINVNTYNSTRWLNFIEIASIVPEILSAY